MLASNLGHEDFVCARLGQSLSVFDRKTGDTHCLNATVSAILKHCDEEPVDRDRLERWAIDDGLVTSDEELNTIIDQLLSIGLLDRQ